MTLGEVNRTFQEVLCTLAGYKELILKTPAQLTAADPPDPTFSLPLCRLWAKGVDRERVAKGLLEARTGSEKTPLRSQPVGCVHPR